MTIAIDHCDTPFGALRIAVDDLGRLVRIDFPGKHQLLPGETESARRCAKVRRQLGEYFAGKRRDFDLECAPAGTPFQQRAWAALQRIPFGRTVSYQDQAVRLGDHKATRAVGAANGRNPIPIVIPCHRVIGKNGKLTGFGGGLDTKKWLLDHERRVLGERTLFET